jgi:hypothetical protein
MCARSPGPGLLTKNGNLTSHARSRVVFRYRFLSASFHTDWRLVICGEFLLRRLALVRLPCFSGLYSYGAQITCHLMNHIRSSLQILSAVTQIPTSPHLSRASYSGALNKCRAPVLRSFHGRIPSNKIVS